MSFDGMLRPTFAKACYPCVIATPLFRPSILFWNLCLPSNSLSLYISYSLSCMPPAIILGMMSIKVY